eukprot:g1231.t1
MSQRKSSFASASSSGTNRVIHQVVVVNSEEQKEKKERLSATNKECLQLMVKHAKELDGALARFKQQFNNLLRQVQKNDGLGGRDMSRKRLFQAADEAAQLRKRRREGRPKRAITAYQLFGKHYRPEVAAMHPHDKPTMILTRLADKWKRATVEEKGIFIEQARQAKDVFDQQMNEYNSQLRKQGKKAVKFTPGYKTVSLQQHHPSMLAALANQNPPQLM